VASGWKEYWSRSERARLDGLAFTPAAAARGTFPAARRTEHRLADLHAAAAPMLAAAAAQLPRLHRYAQRLTSALANAQAGQTGYICSPVLDSYHTIWFELHEELITAAGRTRAEEAAAGRAT